MSTNKQLYNKLLSYGRSLINESFDNPDFYKSDNNTTGIESWYFTHPINYDFANQILFLNNFVFTCTSTNCNWDDTKIDGLFIHFYIDKKDYDKLKEFCNKMDYKTEELSYGYGQLKNIDEEYTKLLDDYMLIYVYDNKTERKTLYLELGLYFNELNKNIYDIDYKWLSRDFYDKLIEKLQNNSFVKKSLDYLDKIKELGVDILEHRIYSTNNMIIFNYDDNKIEELRNKLNNKYKLEKFIDEDYYLIRNELYNKDDNWYVFYEDLYNVFIKLFI